jgi:uridine kinase
VTATDPPLRALVGALGSDHPSAFETSLLVRHLEELKAGRSVDVPVYDFDTHLRRSGEVVRMYPPRVIILEGILLFVEPALRDVIDVKVFVDANADVRFIRRLRRDIAERGRSAEQVCVQYLESVRAMHSAFVEPSKAAADLIIPNDRDSAECYGAAVDALVSHAHAYSQSPKRIKLQ